MIQATITFRKMTSHPIKLTNYKKIYKRTVSLKKQKTKKPLNENSCGGSQKHKRKEKVDIVIDFWLPISVPPDLSHQQKEVLLWCSGAKDKDGSLTCSFRQGSQSLAENIPALAHPKTCCWHLPPHAIPTKWGFCPSRDLWKHIF